MQKYIPFIIAILVAGGGGFYGGMKYAESKNPARNFQSLQNFSPEERQMRLREMGMDSGAFQGRGGGAQSGFVAGVIIAKDDKSITIKMRDARLPDGQGGSKIVFFSEVTEVGKFVNGAPGDLEVGKNVSVNGTPNQDGSITAQSIQIRPLPLTNEESQ